MPTNDQTSASADHTSDVKPTEPDALKWKTSSTLIRLGAGGALLLLGILLCAIGLGFWVIPYLLGVTPMNWIAVAILNSVGIGFIVVGTWFLLRVKQHMEPTVKMPEPQRSDVLYGRHLVGIGFALLADALINVVIVTALAWSVGRAQPSPDPGSPAAQLHGDSFDGAALAQFNPEGRLTALEVFGSLFGSSAEEAVFIAILFILSTLVALLGALFFFANSLWNKMKEPERDPFDRSLFWAGLWFRIGEAVLFNLVFFLMLRLVAPDQYLLLPLVSLLVGMFLKSGEQLVAGLANRLFASLAELLPIERGLPEPNKLLAIRLSGLPVEFEEREAAVNSIGQAMWHLRGVRRPVIDTERLIARVQYDPNKVAVDDILQAVQLLGYEATVLSPQTSQT